MTKRLIQDSFKVIRIFRSFNGKVTQLMIVNFLGEDF